VTIDELRRLCVEARNMWLEPEEWGGYDPDETLTNLRVAARSLNLLIDGPPPIVPIGKNILQLAIGQWIDDPKSKVESWDNFHTQINEIESSIPLGDPHKPCIAQEALTEETLPDDLTPQQIKYVQSLMGQRDHFVYEKRKDGMQNPQVIAELWEIFSVNGWEPLTVAQSIRNAVKRWCINTGASPLEKVGAGRPKAKNPQAKNAK
jgi:hypothetical protein